MPGLSGNLFQNCPTLLLAPDNCISSLHVKRRNPFCSSKGSTQTKSLRQVMNEQSSWEGAVGDPKIR